MTDVINDKNTEFTSFKRIMHLLYWIKSCIGGRLNLHKYSRKYPEAMTLVVNNPNLADKNCKDFFYTVESKLCYSIFDPDLTLRIFFSSSFFFCFVTVS